MTIFSTRRPRPCWIVLVAATGGLLLGTGGCTTDNDQTSIASLFPDPALAACVAADFTPDRAATDTISHAELAELRTLNCNGDGPGHRRIRSLAGVHLLVNLAGADLLNNNISDLTPLTRTTRLSTLKLTNNQVSDLGPLRDLSLLNEVGLSGLAGNRIAHADWVTGCVVDVLQKAGVYVGGLA